MVSIGRLLRGVAAAGAVCAAASSGAAFAQAVAYPNFTPGIMGGVWDGQFMGALEGRWTTPLDNSYGAQFDGILGTVGGSTYGQVAGHVFWRDPGQSLLGIYGAWTQAYGATSWRLGPEFEFYSGNNTLTGVGGVRWIDGTTGGFLQVKAQHYSDPNTREFVGYIYEGESFVNAGFEHEFAHDGKHNGWTVQGEVRAGTGVAGAWIGLRKYFGDGTPDQDKSLIDRDRKDVAPIWLHLTGKPAQASSTDDDEDCPEGEIYYFGEGCAPIVY